MYLHPIRTQTTKKGSMNGTAKNLDEKKYKLRESSIKTSIINIIDLDKKPVSFTDFFFYRQVK